MASYYLIGGHGAGDPGAVGHGYEEWRLARDFNDKLAKYLKQLGEKVTIYNSAGNVNTTKDMYQQTAKGKGLWAKTPNNDVIIETHFNAGTSSAHGTETLICLNLAADKYDKAMHRSLIKFFTDRGIKKRGDLLNMNVAKERGLNYRLNEMCFISNKSDVTKFVGEMDKIALDMAEELSGKSLETSEKIGEGKFVGQSGVEVYVELFPWDEIVYYLNDLDKYNCGVKIHTSDVRNIYSVSNGGKVGEFKPDSIVRYMSIPVAVQKKMAGIMSK